MKLRALIVDDMPLSRSRMQRYLAGEPDIEVIGECGDGETALADIARNKPDLLLLDVQMPGMTGLQLLAKLPQENRPATIFVTAFEEFAVEAFAAEAIDYLLKPFDRERLHLALDRARAYLARQPQTAAYPDRIAVKSVGRIEYVATSDIDWIDTAGNYLNLHCGKDAYMVRETMSRFERLLDPKAFVRIHRSAIVRIDAVRTVEPLFNGDRALSLRDGTKLTLSRTYRDKAKAVFGEI